MEYPGDFDVPTFTAGKSIAISRVMGIGVLISLFLIIVMCGMILWVGHSRVVEPVVLTMDTQTNQWNIIHSDNKNEIYPTEYALQESIVSRFVTDWFSVSTNTTQNEKLWQKCGRTDTCVAGTHNRNSRFNDKTCAIMCMSSDALYTEFIAKMVPQYQVFIKNGQSLAIMQNTLRIIPVTGFSENGGIWRVTGTVKYNSGRFDIIAYVGVARNVGLYPQTIGYYIDSFNAYRVK